MNGLGSNRIRLGRHIDYRTVPKVLATMGMANMDSFRSSVDIRRGRLEYPRIGGL